MLHKTAYFVMRLDFSFAMTTCKTLNLLKTNFNSSHLILAKIMTTFSEKFQQTYGRTKTLIIMVNLFSFFLEDIIFCISASLTNVPKVL